MLSANLRAENVVIDRTKPVPLYEIYDRVMRGEIIVVPQCLQALNYFEQLKQASLEGIRQVSGEKKAARVKEEGFEVIHKIIDDVEEITSIVNSISDIFRSLAPDFLRVLVKEIFLTKKCFFFEEDPNVRFHIPYDLAIRRKAKLRGWNGKITPHGPHHDSWYSCPTNCINLWIAIGSVKIGNGLSIYPQVYGKRLPCTNTGNILPNQYYGQAVNFELDPGDLIIFQGDHLHGSEINSTDVTRHVVSFRITLEKPSFLGESLYKYDYIYSEFNEGIAARCRQFVLNTFYSFAKYINSLFRNPKTQSYVISAVDSQAFDNTSENFPSLLLLEDVEAGIKDKKKLVFNSSELPVGTIRPISQEFCITRLDEQRVAVFSRYCPHEGADLAAGYLRDGCIICPWHNLAFNTDGGASPCRSLSKLSVFNYVQSDNQDTWKITSSCNQNQGGY